jgi:hypothetical protein
MDAQNVATIATSKVAKPPPAAKRGVCIIDLKTLNSVPSDSTAAVDDFYLQFCASGFAGV